MYIFSCGLPHTGDIRLRERSASMYGLNTLLWWTTAFVGGGSPVKKGADVSHPNHRGLDLMTAIASYAC